jgi:hypothetical protein
VHSDLCLVHHAAPHVQAAGLFHSIYGTEGFQGATVPLTERAAVRRLIGSAAELVVFVNCVMDRVSFDSIIAQCAAATSLHGAAANDQVYLLASRPEFTTVPEVPSTIQLHRQQLSDLAQVHLADWADLVASYNLWFYRRSEYRAIARLLGGTFEGEYRAVMATEPTGTTADNTDVPEMVKARKMGVFERVQSGEMSYSHLLSQDERR